MKPCAQNAAECLQRHERAWVWVWVLLLRGAARTFGAGGGTGNLKKKLSSNAIRNDLQHPNEFVRGSTLRTLCKVREPEILEPLVPSIRANLVRAAAAFGCFPCAKCLVLILPPRLCMFVGAPPPVRAQERPARDSHRLQVQREPHAGRSRVYPKLHELGPCALRGMFSAVSVPLFFLRPPQSRFFCPLQSRFFCPPPSRFFCPPPFRLFCPVVFRSGVAHPMRTLALPRCLARGPSTMAGARHVVPAQCVHHALQLRPAARDRLPERGH